MEEYVRAFSACACVVIVPGKSLVTSNGLRVSPVDVHLFSKGDTHLPYILLHSCTRICFRTQDGCLDLTEFTTLVHAVSPTTDDVMIMEVALLHPKLPMNLVSVLRLLFAATIPLYSTFVPQTYGLTICETLTMQKQMYNLALDCTGEGDNIAQVFLRPFQPSLSPC